MHSLDVEQGKTAFSPSEIARAWPFVLVALVVAIALGLPAAAFTFDEAIYIQMAHAMANEGALSFRQMHLEGVDSLTLRYAEPTGEGRLTPQYPFGYGVIAAPFYALFGLNGLYLMNALAGVAAVFLVHRMTQSISGDDESARIAALLFAVASIAAPYYFAIWPHMTALAFLLAGLYGAFQSAAVNIHGKNRLRAALIAGVCIGIGATIRVDVIFAAVAVMLWLRFFIGREAKWVLLAFIAALGGILAMAAFVNHIKFGSFNPLSYNFGGDDPRAFMVLVMVVMTAGVTALSALMPGRLELIHRIRAKAQLILRQKPLIFVGAGVVALGVGAIVAAPLAELLKGLIVLLIDLRLFVSPEAKGVTFNAWGLAQFFETNKKALLQSMPFLVLSVIPLRQFLSSDAPRGAGLLWLTAGAFVGVFALSSWHGGLSFNMRYYLPAAAVLCILIGPVLRDLLTATKAGDANAGAARFSSAIRLSFAGFLLFFVASTTETPWGDIAEVYPQLLIVSVTAFALGHYLVQPDAKSARRALLASGVAIGASASINLGDLIRDQNQRLRTAGREAAYSAAFDPGSLIATDSVARYGNTITGALTVVYPGLDKDKTSAARFERVVRQYQAAGRCVYLDEETERWLEATRGQMPTELAVHPVDLTQPRLTRLTPGQQVIFADAAFSAERSNPTSCLQTLPARGIDERDGK